MRFHASLGGHDDPGTFSAKLRRLCDPFSLTFWEPHRMKISSEVRWYKEDDQLVLLNLESGRYFSLNPTGTRLWDAISNGRTKDDCARLLKGSYGISEDIAERDVADFLHRLEEVGIVRLDT